MMPRCLKKLTKNFNHALLFLIILALLEHPHCQRFSLCGFADRLGKVTPTALELCYSSLGALLQNSCKVTTGLLE